MGGLTVVKNAITTDLPVGTNPALMSSVPVKCTNCFFAPLFVTVNGLFVEFGVIGVLTVTGTLPVALWPEAESVTLTLTVKVPDVI